MSLVVLVVTATWMSVASTESRRFVYRRAFHEHRQSQVQCKTSSLVVLGDCFQCCGWAHVADIFITLSTNS
uniref:Putative secreted protein n=1 Tax=Ixodes ricinus TaxID=34613 RepID=A0A6B0TRX8_IXORI